MNPSIKGARLDRERRLDPTRYAREYEAALTDDSQAFLPLEWITAAIVLGRFELPPMPGLIYAAGCDPSGGGSDAFTFSISHPEINAETGTIVIVQDLLRGQARTRTNIVDLEAVVKEYADLCKRYGCPEVVADKYAAGWVKQAFERHGIRYIDAPEKLAPCTVTGCVKVADAARGLCHKHYSRWKRLGDPLLHSRRSPGAESGPDYPRLFSEDVLASKRHVRGRR